MNFIKCEICDKSFTGMVCFQQHEASEKHKNKLMISQLKTPSNISTASQVTTTSNSCPKIFHCSTCEIDFTELEKFLDHVNSLQHADKVKRMSTGNMDVDDDSINCKPESSTSCANEVASPGYNLNSSVSFSSATSVQWAKCDACQMTFSGPQPYQQHLASEKHKKKSFRKELNSSSLDFDSFYSDKAGATAPNVKAYAECSFCSLKFTGPEDYRQHIDSADHIRKVASSNITSEKPTKAALSSFRCDVCDKDFTGPIPYNDHMISKVHSKKVASVELLKKLASTTAFQPDSTANVLDCPAQPVCVSGNNFYCEVCKVHCSGPIPFEMHVQGEGHQKKMKATELEHYQRSVMESLKQNNLGKASESVQEMRDEVSEEKKSNLMGCSDKKNEFSKDSCISKDLILCEGLKNIGNFPEEVSLNVTTFYPNDEIVFA